MVKPSGRTLLVGSVILWVLAGAAYGTLRLTYGQRPARVNVRWVGTVDAATREQLELAYQLTRGELREGSTWRYHLMDVSTDNLRDLVGDPAVDDTHYIHRTAFRIWRTAGRDPYVTSRPAWIASTLNSSFQRFSPSARWGWSWDCSRRGASAAHRVQSKRAES